MERISLEEAVKEAVKNQSYFLIQYGFEIILEIKDVWVYSDKRWMIYLLDQLIANAIKYRSRNPKLVFSCEKQGENQVCLRVEAVSYTHLDVYKRQRMKKSVRMI